MSKDKLLKPDHTKTNFSIKIDVHENCSTFSILKGDVKGYKANYHEIIGAMEIARTIFMMNQSEANRKARKKARTKSTEK